jgi:hypothetical protein
VRHAALMSSLFAAAALAGCAPLDRPMSGFGQATRTATAEQCDPPSGDTPPIASSGSRAAMSVMRYMQDRPKQPGAPNGGAMVESGSGAAQTPAASSPAPSGN